MTGRKTAAHKGLPSVHLRGCVRRAEVQTWSGVPVLGGFNAR